MHQASLICYQDDQQIPNFYQPNFIKRNRDAKYYLYICTGSHLIMLSFHFECKYSGNFKSFVSPESWALYLSGAFFMWKKKKKKEFKCVTLIFKV